MIVDSHCHAAPNWYEPVETLLHHMDRNGVQQAILTQMLGRFDNAYLLECSRIHADRLASVVAVDPGAPDAVDTLRRLVDAGACGVRLRPGARSPQGDPLALWRAATDCGIPVSCVGTSALFSAPEFFELVAALPRLTIVLEHMAGSSRPDASEAEMAERAAAFELARYPNVFLKLHGLGELTPRADTVPAVDPPWAVQVPAVLMDALDTFSTTRLMWGSDFPVVSSREGYGNALRWSMNAVARLNPAATPLIFGGTATRVFGLT